MVFQGGILSLFILIFIIILITMNKRQLDKIAKEINGIVVDLELVRKDCGYIKDVLSEKFGSEIYKIKQHKVNFNESFDDFDDILGILEAHFKKYLDKLRREYGTLSKNKKTSKSAPPQVNNNIVNQNVVEITKENNKAKVPLLQRYNEAVHSNNRKIQSDFLKHVSWLDYTNSVPIISEKNPLTPIFKYSNEPRFFFIDNKNEPEAYLLIKFDAVLDKQERDLINSCFSIQTSYSDNYLTIKKPAVIEKNDDHEWLLTKKGEVCLPPPY